MAFNRFRNSNFGKGWQNNSGRKESTQYEKFLKGKRQKSFPTNNRSEPQKYVSIKDDNELQKFLKEKRQETNKIVDDYRESKEPGREKKVNPPELYLERENEARALDKLDKDELQRQRDHSRLHGLPDIRSPNPNDRNGINTLVGNPFVTNYAAGRFGPMMNPDPNGPRPEPHQPWAKPPLSPKDGYGAHYFDGGARRTKRRKRRKYRKNRRTKCRRTKSRKKRTRRNKYKKHTKTKRGCRKSN